MNQNDCFAVIPTTLAPNGGGGIEINRRFSADCQLYNSTKGISHSNNTGEATTIVLVNGVLFHGRHDAVS